MAIDYPTWQKLRKEAQDREVSERHNDAQFARPPLQVGVTDQILRDLIDRVQRLERAVSKPTSPVK